MPIPYIHVELLDASISYRKKMLLSVRFTFNSLNDSTEKNNYQGSLTVNFILQNITLKKSFHFNISISEDEEIKIAFKEYIFNFIRDGLFTYSQS